MLRCNHWTIEADRARRARFARFARVLLLIAGMTPEFVLAAADTPRWDVDWRMDAARLQRECERGLTQARQELAAAMAAGKDDALARLRAIESANAGLDARLSMHVMLADVYIDNDDAQAVEAIHAAARACRSGLAQFHREVDLSPDAWRIARDAREQAKDPIDQQLARVYIEAGERTGAPLSRTKRARLAKALARVQSLEEAFQQALGADRSEISLTADEVDALPPVLREQTRVEGRHRVLPVAMRNYEPFMRNVADGALRERFMRAYFEIGGKANSERVAQAARARDEIARLLGHRDWAEQQLAARMAGTPARAQALVDRLSTALRPRAEQELARLAAMKRADGDPRPFAAWDYAFYQQRYEREHFAVDAQAIARYFPSAPMIAATMRWYERIFDVRFEAQADVRLWDPEARLYLLRDARNDEALAWCVIDIAPRAEKALRPASGALRSGRALPDGGYQLPIALIQGSGPAATADTPALFTHRDAVEFFHEFGHLMHASLSRARYASLHGTRVRVDFVEMPSQMFENWLWQPSVLRAISHHVDTGAPLNDDQIKAMLAARHAADGVFWTRQTFLAAFDLALHQRARLAPDALWYRLAPRYTPLPMIADAHPVASFMPVMGGYDAGYYGYLWSRVYAADVFDVFAREGLDSPEVGRRFREQVLAPGGEIEPDALLRRFLGREPDITAWLRELGLASDRPAMREP